MTTPDEPMVTVRLPRSHWVQIVDDIQNMAGRSRFDPEDPPEILSSIEVLDGDWE